MLIVIINIYKEKLPTISLANNVKCITIKNFSIDVSDEIECLMCDISYILEEI